MTVCDAIGWEGGSVLKECVGTHFLKILSILFLLHFLCMLISEADHILYKISS